MTYKEKLQKRFEELDKKPHIDYRIIAFTLAMDYHKLDLKYKRLEKETTKELESIILSSVPRYKGQDGRNNVQRTFQAIRIEVNGELDALSTFLDKAVSKLRSGGRLAVISFHSLEDRIVKEIFKEKCESNWNKNMPFKIESNKSEYRLVNKKPIEATQEELEVNNRAHSAKLRIIERV